MSLLLFNEYRGFRERDGLVAAVQVTRENIRTLAPIVGGTAVTKTVRGGSQEYYAIMLRGEAVKVGDYLIADRGGVYIRKKQEIFEMTYRYKGPLAIPTSERR